MFAAINDFSDRISPVLVKELRQGMRAKLFTGTFLGLQIFLSVILLSIGSASSNLAGTMISGVIFALFSVVLLVFQPLRGVNALHGEIKDRTIDMMVLTKLDASRIVLGKWIAIVGQSAILLATIAPYLILRYFFGGMELLQELMLMFLIFCTSLTLTAITVGLSACSNVFIRGLLPILGLPIFFVSIFGLLFAPRSASPFDFLALSNPEHWWIVAGFLLFLTYLGYSMISLGASLIAPAAENHSIIRRFFAAALIIATGIAGYFGIYDEEWHYIILFLISFPALVIALTESSPQVETTLKPFLRWGLMSRLAGKFLLPTWASGVVFSLLFFLLNCLAFGMYRDPVTNSRPFGLDEWIIFLGCTGGLLFPAVWQAVFFRGEVQRLNHYLLVFTGSAILLTILAIIVDSTNSLAALYVFCWHPFAFVASLNHGTTHHLALIFLIFLLSLYYIILMARLLLIERKNNNSMFPGQAIKPISLT